MLIQKKIDRLRHYFLNDSRVRKISLERKFKSFSLQFNCLNKSFPDLLLTQLEFDYFSFFLVEKPNYTIESITQKRIRFYASLGQELGYNQTLSILWEDFRFERTLIDSCTTFPDFYNLWKKNANLRYLADCSHDWDPNCEACLTVDSFREGCVGLERSPVVNQKNKKHELIYLVGRDKYFESKGVFPTL
jgi:hypothetical protein